MPTIGPTVSAPAGLALTEVASLVGGRVVGVPDLRIRDVAPLDEAERDELALLADRRYLADVSSSRAGALLVAEKLAAKVQDARPLVIVDDPHYGLVKLLPELHPPVLREPSVHTTAVLGRGVVLGSGVEIGPYAFVDGGAQLGDRVRLGAHVVVGRDARVGDDTVLYPHVVLYPHTELGQRVIVHAGARLGSDGFGYAFVDGEYRKVPQVGRCVVEDDVEIGANATVDRGSIGSTSVGRGSKLDNLVHLAHNVRVGPGCAMAAQVGIAGSTQLGNGVQFGGQSGAIGHLEIGDGVRISAQAGVTGDVAPRQTMTGFPARELQQYMRAWAWTLRLPELARRIRALESRVGVSERGEGVPG